MAEDFQSGLCSGSWWSTSRSAFDGAVPPASRASCSAGTTDVDPALIWAPEAMEGGRTEHVSRLHSTDPMLAGGALMETTTLMADITRSSTLDWSQAILGNGRVDGGFHAVPPEDPIPKPYYRREAGRESVNKEFMLGEAQLNAIGDPGGCVSESYPVCPSPILCSSPLFQGLDAKSQRQFYCDGSTNVVSSPVSYLLSSQDSYHTSWPRFPDYFKVGSPPHLEMQLYAPQIPFEEKLNASLAKPSSEVARGSSSGGKKSGCEPAANFKKPRMETPSSLPTFKVRKEKLGDRITALQQLVSPFGKTDTASVLYEAIDYIKFLHEQVSVLSNPYLQNGPSMQPRGNSDMQKDGDNSEQCLRSRGLCLVPISSTLTVANEPMADFWTPTFGGSYR